ncbi:MAG: hypothetical protein J5952_05230 [Prevotella sp.]|nr:hypothetical protein [Prevotella sp.]
MKTCYCCRRELPLEQFEQYATGTRRGICRHCHYVMHGKRAKRKWRLRQLAEVLLRR